MKTFDIPESVRFFPNQKRSERDKTKQFFKDCADVGIQIAEADNVIETPTGVRSTTAEMMINYNLYNDIVDKQEVEKTLNPLGMFNTDTFPATYKNYPLLNPSISLLCGEERKRVFIPMVSVINADAVSSKQEQKKGRFFQWYMETLQSQIQDEEELEKMTQDFQKYMQYTWQDLRERMGNQLLNYLYHTQDIKEEFSRGFKDAVSWAGEEIYSIEIFGGKPTLKKLDPMTVKTVRSGNSWKIEDSDIIVVDTYIPQGEVLDRYYDELTDSEVKQIEEGNLSPTSSPRMLRPELHLSDTPNIEYVDLRDMPAPARAKWMNHIGGAYDSEGNVRVTRVLWSGMRQIKILYRFNEFGELEKDVMPEQYVPNKELGERVKVEWVREWYEATKIGPGIYVKMGPCEVQVRDLDNLSESSPPIVGSIYQVGSMTGKGIIGLGKEWQYLWNTFMYKVKLAFAQDYGKIGMFPVHLIPENWSMEKALYWATQLKLLPIDAFNAGQEGFAKGKLAGAMSGIPTHINLSNHDQIRSHLEMLTFIKQEVDNLTGITPQRKGAIDNRETVGGVERSVMQSSNITEEWFSIHDNTKVRALRVLLEAAKIAYRGESFVKEYIMDDGTRELLQFDYDVFKEASYGVDVTNATDDMQTLQYIKSLGERYLQASGSFAMAIEIARTKNVASIANKIREHEAQMQEQQAQQAEAEREAAQTLLQQQQELELLKIQIDQEKAQMDREFEAWKTEQDNATRIAVAEINVYRFQEDLDQNQNQVPDIFEISEAARKDREQTTKEYIGKLEQQRKDKEVEYKRKIEERKAQLEEKKMTLEKEKMENAKKLQKMKDDAAMDREKLKAKTALANPVAGEKK